jgi:WD40 repeat protein
VEIEGIPQDFYISPLDWSRQNLIAFALTDDLVFMNPKTADIIEPSSCPYDIVSVKFDQTGNQILLGSHNGFATIYDVPMADIILTTRAFRSSILCADWKGDLVIAGGRAGEIALMDPRDDSEVEVINGHFQEVCAVKMHPDLPIVATSGNECCVKIWDLRNWTDPLLTYSEHEAAVRALEWSPIAKDILITGGGTADRTIKKWNCNTGETLKSVDTGSQVCNLFWSPSYNEILSTHGFSQNNICVWRAHELSMVGSIHPHRERVLFMAISPDGSDVATAAPGDTLQIWKMFPSQWRTATQAAGILR